MYGAELSQAAPLPAPALKSKRCLLLIKRPEKGLALPLPGQLPALLAKDNSVVLPFPPEPAGERAAGKAAGEVRRNQQPAAASCWVLSWGFAGRSRARGERPKATRRLSWAAGTGSPSPQCRALAAPGMRVGSGACCLQPHKKSVSSGTNTAANCSWQGLAFNWFHLPLTLTRLQLHQISRFSTICPCLRFLQQ